MQKEDNINPDQQNRVDPSEDLDALSRAPSGRVDPSEDDPDEGGEGGSPDQ